MSNASDSEDDRSNANYLNSKLKCKVSDSNSKEKPRPYFKSVPVVGQSKDSKDLIFDIMHSLNEMPDPIEVSNYPTLLHFGMGLATIDGTELPSDESSLFVLHAARDCAARANFVLTTRMQPKRENHSKMEQQ